VERASLQNRLVVFIRSVMPADPTQLIFVAGVICTVIAPRLAWFPGFLAAEPIILVARFPIIFAGIAGYFVCFWPGPKPARRVFWAVCVPLITALAVIFGVLIYLNMPTASIIGANRVRTFFGLVQPELRALPPGFQVALLGLFLVGMFLFRLALGIASLPVVFDGENPTESGDSELWRRIRVLTWVVIGPLFLLVNLPLTIVILALLTTPWHDLPAWYPRVAATVPAFFFLGITLWIVGKTGRQLLRSWLRLPGEKYLILALAFPLGVEALISTGQYFQARALWATKGFGTMSTPQFASYFSSPDAWLLLLFLPAFAEEIAFRGLIQQGFIKRFGLYRGIFLTGIVWAAFHFYSDTSARSTLEQVVLRLGFRVFMCLAFGFVLSWLTLQSGSILPATVTHTLYNIFVLGNFGLPFTGKVAVRVLLFGVLAGLLFRFWPVPSDDRAESSEAESGLETAS
jgi:membrane protease YdiL (CAAX protease family)